MLKFCFNDIVSSCSPPCNEPVTAAAIATAAVPAVISAIGNVLGISSSNSANKKIAREQMAHQYKMFQEANQFTAEQAQINRDYQTQMYNQAYVDNSPLAQRAAMSAAGLNMSGTTPTQAQPTQGAMGSSVSTPSLNMPTMQPAMIGSYMAEGIKAISDAIASNKVASAEERNSETNALRLSLDKDNSKWTNLYYHMMANKADAEAVTIDRMRSLQARQSEAQTVGILADANYTMVQTKLAPLLAQSNIDLNSAKAQNTLHEISFRLASLETQLAVAHTNASAMRYAADQNLFGVKYSANRSYMTGVYERGLRKQMFDSNLRFEINKAAYDIYGMLKNLGLQESYYQATHGGFVNKVLDNSGLGRLLDSGVVGAAVGGAFGAAGRGFFAPKRVVVKGFGK